MLPFLGVASGVVWLSGCLPYIRDIFRHTTKPERASWFIWTVLGAITFFSQQAEGATWSLWLAGLTALGVLVIFCLSIKYGVGGLRRRDFLALIIAASGLLLWYLTRHAYIALLISIFIDAIASILIIFKAYEVPESETLSSYVFFATSGILGALSVGKFNPILLSYPLYIFAANFITVIIILFARSRRSNLKSARK